MRIAAYCRVSTDSNEQIESLENQKLFFSDFAKKNGWQLVKIYADEGISGKQMKNRTEFLKMLNDAERGMFDMVVVKDISRFARNTVDFLNSIRGLKSRGIDAKFLSSNQTILGDSEFILTIFSAMAQEESANLSKRVKFGKKINAQKGRVPTRVYGYTRVDNFNLIPDEREAAVVRNIFDMYTNRGYGAGRIAKALTAEGIPTKLSAPAWSSRTVGRILRNPIYIGEHINNKYEIKDYLTGERVLLPQEQNICHKRPEFRIVSDEVYYTVQEKIKRNQDLYRHGRDSSRNVFSTLIKCEHCGMSFSKRSYTYKKSRTFWVCTGFNIRSSGFCDNKISIDEVDLLFVLKNYFYSIIGDQTAFIKDIAPEFSASEAEVDKQIKKAETEREKHKTMYINNIIDINDLTNAVEDIDKKLCLLRERKNHTDTVKLEDMFDMKLWTNTGLKCIIDRITVNKSGKVNIYLHSGQQND